MLSVAQQKKNFDAMRADGEIAIASEFSLVIDDREDMTLYFKEFPVPIINPEDEIEVTLQGGQKTGTTAIARTHFKGSCSLIDNVYGKAIKFISSLSKERTVDKRPTVDATIYHGTPENYTQKFRIKSVRFYGFDPFQADTENQTAVVLNGQCSYEHFDETE